MKPDSKKYFIRINLINNSIKEKENELKVQIENKILNNALLNETKNQLENTYRIRNELKNEIDHLNSEVPNRLSEINRIKADLKYKTKKEHEEMIIRLESDMQYNYGHYKPNEEARILNEIQSMKRGIQLLNEFESKKKIHAELIEKLKEKKRIRDANWLNYTILNEKRKHFIENIKIIKKSIEQIEIDLDKFKKQKIEIKKQFRKEQQDYILYLKEIQAKRQVEKDQLENQLKINTKKYNSESIIRDCSKLIQYLQKFQLIDNDEFISNLTTNQTSINSDINNNLNKPNSLELSYSNNSNSTLNTPTNDFINTSTLTTPTIDENGFYIMKKKTNDDCDLNQHKKLVKRNSKCHRRNKPPKITYTPEELCLFEKLQINEPPYSLQQIDECIKNLKQKRDIAQKQLKIYEQQIQLIENLNELLDDEQLYKDNDDIDDDADGHISNDVNEDLVKNRTIIKTTIDCIQTLQSDIYNDNNNYNDDDDDNVTINNAACALPLSLSSCHLFSDTNSEASYFDLNYESDCSSIVKLTIDTKSTETLKINKDCLINNCSDDSDVTLPDNCCSNEKNKEEIDNKNDEDYDKNRLQQLLPNIRPVRVLRQLSDGYSSSSQLSAGSNVSGQNPFFKNQSNSQSNQTTTSNTT